MPYFSAPPAAGQTGAKRNSSACSEKDDRLKYEGNGGGEVMSKYIGYELQFIPKARLCRIIQRNRGGLPNSSQFRRGRTVVGTKELRRVEMSLRGLSALPIDDRPLRSPQDGLLTPRVVAISISEVSSSAIRYGFR